MISPMVSIILPVRNEADYIERSLRAVLEQDYPGEMEILIADGMSTDDTRKIISTIAEQHPQQVIRILDNEGRIVPIGMNTALRQARGGVIIRVDGHCVIAPDYVRRCVDHIQKDHVDGVGGPMESIGETEMAQAIALGMSSRFGVGNSAFRTLSGKNMLADTAPFPAYTRAIIERTGFYDEELVRNQDDEYNYRIRKLGGRIMLAKDVRSTYFSRTSLWGLWRQYFQYGYWKVRVLQKHPLQMSLRQFIPPAFVVSFLFSAVLLLLPMPYFFNPIFWFSTSYLSVNLLVSFYIAGKNGWKYLQFMPIVFIALHFGYGSGFLAGLVKFWNRWNDKLGKTPPWGFENK